MRRRPSPEARRRRDCVRAVGRRLMLDAVLRDLPLIAVALGLLAAVAWRWARGR